VPFVPQAISKDVIFSGLVMLGHSRLRRLLRSERT